MHKQTISKVFTLYVNSSGSFPYHVSNWDNVQAINDNNPEN